MDFTDENHNLIGIFTTDTELKVRVWDAALERMTGIAAASVLGKTLLEAIPDLEARGLLARFQRVLEAGTIEILAPRFHRFLICCPPAFSSARFREMRQRVTIAPLRENEKIRGLLVTVEDVTARMEHEFELAERLADGDESVRLAAAKEISGEPEDLDKDTATPIINALGDKNWRVRRTLVEGLARRAAPDAISALLRAVREKHLDFAVLNSALSVLQATSVETTDALLGFLTSADTDLRIQAALTLGEQRNARAVPGLLEALGDTDLNVRFHAIEALGKIGAPEAVSPLLALAEAGEFFLSFAALEALRQIGDPAAARRVVPLLADETLREAAIETLGAIGNEETVAPLIEILNTDESAALAVSRALAALAERVGGDSVIIVDVRRSIKESGKTNLLAALSGANDTNEISPVRLGGWLADEKIIEKLVDLLENENLREEAARALVGHGAAAVDLLIERLYKTNDETLPVIARALGQIGNPRAFEPLVELLEEGGAAARQAAAEALKSLAHPETIERLCDLLTADETAVREAAIRVVGYFGAKGCEDTIFEFAVNADERVRRAALEQLPLIADERSVPALIRALKEDSPRCRETAAKALAHVKNAEAVAALRGALKDEDSWTRYFAVRALGAVDDPASRAKLSEMAETDDAEHVRTAAREVLSASQL